MDAITPAFCTQIQSKNSNEYKSLTRKLRDSAELWRSQHTPQQCDLLQSNPSTTQTSSRPTRYSPYHKTRAAEKGTEKKLRTDRKRRGRTLSIRPRTSQSSKLPVSKLDSMVPPVKIPDHISPPGGKGIPTKSSGKSDRPPDSAASKMPRSSGSSSQDIITEHRSPRRKSFPEPKKFQGALKKTTSHPFLITSSEPTPRDNTLAFRSKGPACPNVGNSGTTTMHLVADPDSSPTAPRFVSRSFSTPDLSLQSPISASWEGDVLSRRNSVAILEAMEKCEAAADDALTKAKEHLVDLKYLAQRYEEANPGRSLYEDRLKLRFDEDVDFGDGSLEEKSSRNFTFSPSQSPNPGFQPDWNSSKDNDHE